MHVVHVITGLDQGGAEAMLEKLILAARQASPGDGSEVISLTGVGTIGQRLLDAGIRVRALGLEAGPGALRGIPRLAHWLRESPLDAVIQTWMYHADLIGSLAARIAGRDRLVWNVRQTGLSPHDISTSTRFVVRICGRLSRRAPRRIISNSHEAIAAHSAWGYDTSRFVVIPNGFDTQRFARRAEAGRRLRREWGIADDEVAIGLVARMDPQKDHGTFVAMAGRVAQALPQARFVLVGRGVPDSPTLKAMVGAVGLGERTILQGERRDIPEVMSALDVFCLSSRAEGFPNVLGEAMACETPSVTTDCGDASVLIGDDSLVAPIEDGDALASRVLALASRSADKRRDLGHQQRQRIVEHFEVSSIWSQYRALYERL